jgi:hypothetical protein
MMRRFWYLFLFSFASSPAFALSTECVGDPVNYPVFVLSGQTTL